MQIHTVAPGETVYSISRRYNVSQQKIVDDNDLKSPYALAVGQSLVILFPERTYTVKSGDTLFNIARQFGTTVGALYRNNPFLKGMPQIMPGQELVITHRGRKRRPIYVNGYCYPFVNIETLRRTLPYLTALTIFSYSITPDGGLLPIDDRGLIALAKEYSVLPMMHVSTIGESGNFETALSSALFTNETAQNNLIQNIVRVVQEKGYGGVDLDFEYVREQEAQAYVNFTQRLSSILNPMGKEVVVALAPRTSAEQTGILVEGHDYPGMGKAANRTLLMTYEWGYSYGPPMAVAPAPQVRRVMEYAVSAIPRRKILFGIPSYGYNWNIPYQQGARAPSIMPQNAQDLAVETRSDILFDELSKAPHFYYTDAGGQAHVVWFEDARSIQAKLDIVDDYGVDGISYWTVMTYFPQNWLVVNAMYEIEKLL